MPTIEGKQARVWIDAYVKKAGTLEGVTKAVRALVKKTVKGGEEYVNPWKIPSFDSNGPLCCFMVGKEHVTFAFMRGAALPDPEKLLEGTGKGVRHVKLQSVAEDRKSTRLNSSHQIISYAVFCLKKKKYKKKRQNKRMNDNTSYK